MIQKVTVGWQHNPSLDPVFQLEVDSIWSLSLLSGIITKVLWVLRVSHLPGLWCILVSPPSLLLPEVAYLHSFCWSLGIQSFSLTQYKIRFPPSPQISSPIHFPSQVPPSLPTYDCFLLSPKWDWGILTWALQLWTVSYILCMGYCYCFC